MFAIIGLGYVGLPLAMTATSAGLSVMGYDINQATVDALNMGKSHVDDLSDDDVKSMLDVGFRATTDARELSKCDVVVICVPTPLSAEGGPDLAAVKSAAETAARSISSGTTIILESTTYPGTTEELLLPIFESFGHRLDRDFFLAFSPERIDPGNTVFGPHNTPKVVGGVTPISSERAAAFYSSFIDKIVLTKGAREAEMAKLLENTYRHINIALVNEMAKFCHDLDIDLWDAINAAKTKPFGFQAFYPGPGVGGHCIPIDPNYLSHNVKSRLGYAFKFVELAQEINASMPSYIVQRSQAILNHERRSLNGAHILLLGVTYKTNIADQRESPARPIAELFVNNGARVSYYDPHVPQWNISPGTLQSVRNPIEEARKADLTILVQNHSSIDVRSISEAANLVFDTRGTIAPAANVSRL